MANAKPRDTRAGWDIFRRAGGNVSLDDLNGRLVSAGYGPIKPRTLRHYWNLSDAGYERYVPINRFDVARASEPYDASFGSSRYTYRDADTGVEVIFAKANRMFEASGRATEVGDSSAIIRFSEPEVIAGLRKLNPQSGSWVSVRFLETGKSVSGRVEETDLISEPLLVEIEYDRLVSLAEIGIGVPLDTGESIFTLRLPNTSDGDTVDLVGRRIYYFFELLEGVRSLVNAAGALQDESVYASPPILRRLRVASPPIIEVDLAKSVIAVCSVTGVSLVIKAYGTYIDKRKTWHEGTKAKYEAKEIQEAYEDRKRAESEARTEISTSLRDEMPESSIPDEEVDRIIADHVYPPLEGLAKNGISELEVSESEHGKDDVA
jgi:hypothetical protein